MVIKDLKEQQKMHIRLTSGGDSPQASDLI